MTKYGSLMDSYFKLPNSAERCEPYTILSAPEKEQPSFITVRVQELWINISLLLALSSLPLHSNFLGGGEISSLVVVRVFSSASPSPIYAGEGDVRHFHWSAFMFLSFSNELV